MNSRMGDLILLWEFRNKACLWKYVNYIFTSLQVLQVNVLNISTNMISYLFWLCPIFLTGSSFQVQWWFMMHGRNLSESLELDHYFSSFKTFHLSISFFWIIMFIIIINKIKSFHCLFWRVIVLSERIHTWR